MDESQLILTNITRFGTILFIIYTVSILLNVYRYIMKMAAYYEARADALLLMDSYDDNSSARYKSFVESLNAESIDFGKNPSTPIQQVIDIAKAFKK